MRLSDGYINDDKLFGDENITQIACHECDLLLDLKDIAEGQHANCPRCGCLLYTYRQNGLERCLAFAVTASAFLFLANLFPFLAFKAKGHEQVMTLLETALQLYDYGSILLASFVLLFIIIAPAILLFSIIWVLTPFVFKGACAKWSVDFGKLIFHTTPWSMAEVFLIGILVSMVKIASLATVVMGASFWSYIGFTIFITLTMTSLDSRQFWDAIEKAQP